MIWLCGPYEEMSEQAREDLAKLAACGNPLQEQINRQALMNVGGVLSVQERRPGDASTVPPYVVVNLATGNYCTFAGLMVEGADTREEAFERAVRIGQKNDMGVVDLEAIDSYYLCFKCGMASHVDLEWRWFYYDGDELLASEEGTAKEVAECPGCGERHALCESGGKVFAGNREECREERRALLDAGEHTQEEWSEVLDQARKERA